MEVLSNFLSKKKNKFTFLKREKKGCKKFSQEKRKKKNKFCFFEKLFYFVF